MNFTKLYMASIEHKHFGDERFWVHFTPEDERNIPKGFPDPQQLKRGSQFVSAQLGVDDVLDWFASNQGHINLTVNTVGLKR